MRGLHGNSEPSQDGVESSSTSPRERGPPSHIFLPRTWLLASADNPPAFPSEPPGLTPTHSSQAFLSQSFYFLPYPVPQIQRSALKWRLFPGLIETRPPSPPPPPCRGVSSNRDWLPASPPWGSPNKEQLPNLTETKGRLQGTPPPALQLARCPLRLPASIWAREWGGGWVQHLLKCLGPGKRSYLKPPPPSAAKPWPVLLL